MKTRRKVWNKRHKLSSSRPKAPSQFLIENISLLKMGKVLDLASGTGRNAFFLAQKGFQVTALDFSEVALNQIREQARKSRFSIRTIEGDLERENCLNDLNAFDTVIAIHFKLSEDLLPQIPGLLSKNGVFLYCTYNLEQAEQRDFPEKYCLTKGELLTRKWSLDLIKYSTFEDADGYHDGYLFERS